MAMKGQFWSAWDNARNTSGTP